MRVHRTVMYRPIQMARNVGHGEKKKKKQDPSNTNTTSLRYATSVVMSSNGWKIKK